MNKLKTKQQGFTIIEVMIVLVIAAVIILIVFLAVPALQRNSRNNQRRSDASRALAAVSEWSTNNDGKLPSTTTDQSEVADNVKLGYYGQLDWADAAAESPIEDEDVLMIAGGTCTSAKGSEGATATTRRFVALYAVETGSGVASQCTES